MRIGIAGPMDLNIITDAFDNSDRLELENIQSLGGTQPAQYSRWLMKEGHDVFLYTTSISVPRGVVRVYRSRRVTLKIGHRPGALLRMLTFQLGEIRTVKCMIAADQPDIVHAQWSYEFALAAIKTGLPHIITVRDWAPEILLFTRHPYRVMRLLLSFIVFCKGKNFVANSPYLHTKLEFLKSRLLPFIPNAINDSHFIEKRKLFHDDKLVIISINNGADGRKNTRTLLEGFSLLRNKYNNVYLKLIGDGHEAEGMLWNWAREKDMLDSVEFLGSLRFESVLQELDRSDLMVHPSLEESFGNIIVEAMCRGVPVIAGRESGAVPWVVADTGMLIDISSAGAIAEAVQLFLDDKSLLEEYSRAGYVNAKSRFSMSEITKSYNRYYQKIIGGYKI